MREGEADVFKLEERSVTESGSQQREREDRGCAMEGGVKALSPGAKEVKCRIRFLPCGRRGLRDVQLHMGISILWRASGDQECDENLESIFVLNSGYAEAEMSSVSRDAGPF